MLPLEAFLSHSSQDEKFVSKLADELRHHGVPLWYSKTNILGSQQWHDEIGKALNRCDWFLVVLSSNSIQSMWVKREVTFALRQDRLESRIIPIVLEPCEFELLSWALPNLQMVDFSHSFEQGCQDLFRIWSVEYQPKS